MKTTQKQNKMILSEIKTGVIYTDKQDLRVPLMFSGKTKKRNQYGYIDTIVIFNTIKTEDNKNWINAMPKQICIAFDQTEGTNRLTIN